MSKQAYSDLKAAWYLDDVVRLRKGKQIVPKQIHLVISDLCNHDCHFCAYRMSNGFSSEQFGEDTSRGFTMNPNRMIPADKVKEILEDAGTLGVRGIQFTGGGEPTVHPEHLDLFEYAQDLGLKTSLVTNGFLLRDGWEKVYSRMSWIRVSVDAGTPETYAKVRKIKPEHMFRTLSNIGKIGAEIRAEQSDCLLGVGFVVTRENYQEIIEGCHLIKQTGAKYVRLAGMFSHDGVGYYDGIYDEIKAFIQAARHKHEDDEFKIVDLFGDRIDDMRLGRPDYRFCGYQQFVTYIGGNQKVYRCCTTSYTQHGEIGDLSEQRFYDWFKSDQKRNAIQKFNARSCKVCQFNGKNKTVNYLLNRKPLHVEFV